MGIHAHASEALVRVAQQAGVLYLTISDDGVGGATLDTGSGLVGLSDPVEALGGTLAVDSHVGHGTTLRVNLPTGSRS